MNSALPTVYEDENNEAVKMHAHEIERNLAELGQELQNLGVKHRIRILLVGGAFMLTQIHRFLDGLPGRSSRRAAYSSR